MGLDVGEVRIGVAISDETGLIARGLTTLRRVGWKQDLDALIQLADQHDVQEIVIGLPLNLDGSEGVQAGSVADFTQRLRAASPIPVSQWDERLSSVSAERVLIEGGLQRNKRRQVIDKLAAVIILQNFLDHRNSAAFRASEIAIGDHGQD
jgi:putative Holliday junction resolvase